MPLTLPAAHSQTTNVPTHTRTKADTHALNLHLRLISYHIPERRTVSLPLAIHFMLTQHQSAGLPSHSTHPSIAGLLISVTFGENKRCSYPSCISSSDRLHLAVFVGPCTPHRRWLDHSTVCADEYSICPAGVFLSNTLPSSWTLKRPNRYYILFKGGFFNCKEQSHMFFETLQRRLFVVY